MSDNTDPLMLPSGKKSWKKFEKQKGGKKGEKKEKFYGR